jgi:hypothetical protein
MPKRNLDPEELKKANRLLAEIRQRIDDLAGDDAPLRFAFRRKVYKELIYDEREKPSVRRKVKIRKYDEQRGKCAHCCGEMQIKYSELDRRNAVDGYTVENTELVHGACHIARQAAKGYS